MNMFRNLQKVTIRWITLFTSRTSDLCIYKEYILHLHKIEVNISRYQCFRTRCPSIHQYAVEFRRHALMQYYAY